MKELDFYGVNKMKEDPAAFKKAVEEKKKMESGEEIAVDAMQAFYLICNSKHHDLIVSEDGKINFKKIQTDTEIEEMKNKIMSFEREGRDPQLSFKVPGYVERVEDLECGGVKWVFTKEHAEWCKFESTCYDKYSRSMPDPDKVEVEDKRSSRSSNGTLEKELKKYNENRAEERYKEDLAKNAPTQTKKSKRTKTADERVKGDADILEEQYPIPAFLQTEQCVQEEPIIEEEKVEDIEVNNEEIILEKTNYHDITSLVLFFKNNRHLNDLLINKIFSENGIGFVFLDFVKKTALIEKNYFVQTIKTFLDKDGHLRFDSDFLAKDAISIFDGYVVNDFIGNIDFEKYFESYPSKDGNKYLWNVLIESVDVADVFYTGWFVKIQFKNIEVLETFIEQQVRGFEVQITAEVPKEIKRLSKRIEKIKTFY
ncbi:MAG: hypothetical protein PHX13_10445 [Thiovulaceae bacterium]|nr:hypothetical protein [Sulfurimonadaceae bacterium]